MKTLEQPKRQAAQPGGLPAATGYAVPLRKIRRGGRCYVPEHNMLEVYRRTGGFVDRYYDGVRYTVQLTMDTMVLPASPDSLTCPHTAPALAQSGGEKTTTKESNS